MVYVGETEPVVRATPTLKFFTGAYITAIGSAGSVLAAVVTAVGNKPQVPQPGAVVPQGGQQVVHYPLTTQGVPPQQPVIMQHGPPPQAGSPAPRPGLGR